MAQISGFFEAQCTGLTLHLLTIVHLYSIVAVGIELWGYGTRLSGLSEGGSLRGRAPINSIFLHLSLHFVRCVHYTGRVPAAFSPLRRRGVAGAFYPIPSLLVRSQPRGSVAGTEDAPARNDVRSRRGREEVPKLPIEKLYSLRPWMSTHLSEGVVREGGAVRPCSGSTPALPPARTPPRPSLPGGPGGSLRPGSSFAYTPALPFVEDLLPPRLTGASVSPYRTSWSYPPYSRCASI